MASGTSEVVRISLEQDIGSGDITSEALLPKGARMRAAVVARQSGIIAGVPEFRLAMKGLKVKALKRDGQRVRKGEKVFIIDGSARKILSRERVALNVLSRMSGIATETRRLCRHIRVAATRKSPPGCMEMDKRAVSIGGGWPHRRGLWEFALIKDNHLAYLGWNVERAVQLCKRTGKKVEVEAETLQQALRAARTDADIIMLDNFTPARARNAVKKIRKINRRAKIELSGGITEKNITKYAKCGADFVSMGCITNSAKALDFSMEAL